MTQDARLTTRKTTSIANVNFTHSQFYLKISPKKNFSTPLKYLDCQGKFYIAAYVVPHHIRGLKRNFITPSFPPDSPMIPHALRPSPGVQGG